MLSAAQPDEVVEVFSGDTLEEAMAHAVATLGPDLTVRRARRVRKGVQGLRGKERYEVVAVPAPRPAGDAVGSAFDALLQQAEQDEHTAQPEPVRRTDEPPVLLEAVPLVAPLHPAPEAQVFDQELLAPAPAPAPADQPRPDPAEGARVTKAPARRTAPSRTTATPRRTAPPAVRRTGESGWSRSALSRLGLPKPVLAALPEHDPHDDLAWVAALAKALATVLPDPDPRAAVVISGSGLEGVLGILAAARKGYTPGTITYAGRTAPATPTELALAVRTEVLR